MEFLTLQRKPFQWLTKFLQNLHLVEGPTQSTSSNQPVEPSPDMVHERLSGYTGDSSKRGRRPDNEGHEGHPRTSSKATPREDQSALRSQQIERSRHPENPYHKLYSAYRGVQTQLQETQTKFKDQQHEIDSLKEKLSNASVLLDARNQELKVAKAFLSKEDQCSVSDVVQTVRDLNSGVMQTAALLADNLALRRVRNYPTGNIPEEPYRSIFAILVLPQGSAYEVDAVSLELALQGFLNVWLYWITNLWGFSGGSGWHDEIYSKVCENEDPAVASNWRALTRRTLSSIDANQGDLPRRIVNDTIEQLASLLSYCGIGEPFYNAQSIRKHAAEPFGSLFAAARKLSKMIGENIVSDDLGVVIIGGGYLFESKNMALDDAYDRGGTEPGQRVFCTTGLGLCEREGRMLMKPKVVLSRL